MLTDTDDMPSGVVVEARLQKALDDAAGLIDGYLAGQYAVPLATVPAAVRTHCMGWARYLLMQGSPDERAVADQKAAERYFELVARGTVQLFAPQAAMRPQSSTAAVEFHTSPTVFGRGEF